MSVRALRRAATAAATGVLALSAVAMSATSAQAATYFNVKNSGTASDGDRTIRVNDGTALMGPYAGQPTPTAAVRGQHLRQRHPQ